MAMVKHLYSAFLQQSRADGVYSGDFFKIELSNSHEEVCGYD